MSAQGIEDLMTTYRGWMNNHEGGPIYQEMRTRIMKEINNELKEITGKTFSELDGEAQENIS